MVIMDQDEPFQRSASGNAWPLYSPTAYPPTAMHSVVAGQDTPLNRASTMLGWWPETSKTPCRGCR
jgi:hypothetical protein